MIHIIIFSRIFSAVHFYYQAPLAYYYLKHELLTIMYEDMKWRNMPYMELAKKS